MINLNIEFFSFDRKTRHIFYGRNVIGMFGIPNEEGNVNVYFFHKGLEDPSYYTYINLDNSNKIVLQKLFNHYKDWLHLNPLEA